MTSKVPNDLEPGAIVYKPFQPKKVGKVLERIILPKEFQGRTWSEVSYRVHWEDGSETTVVAYHVNVLADLIDKHEKALATHRASMKRGLAL